MATVRHSTCRIDFDPADVTGKSVITVTDTDGVVLDTIEIKTTHLVAAVAKQTMVQVRRNTALARLIGKMDDELSGADYTGSALPVPEYNHEDYCSVEGSHLSDQCAFYSTKETNQRKHARVCSYPIPHASDACALIT
jgi:hypothetical protein